MAIVYTGKAKKLAYSNSYNELYAMVRGAGYTQLELVFTPPKPGKRNMRYRAVRFHMAHTGNDMQSSVTVNLAYDDIKEILERSLLIDAA